MMHRSWFVDFVIMMMVPISLNHGKIKHRLLISNDGNRPSFRTMMETEHLTAISVKTTHSSSQASSKFISTLFLVLSINCVELVLDNRNL